MYVSVNGARLFVDVDGEGLSRDGHGMRQKPTVILVHGGPGSDHTVHKPYFSQLTDIAQVIYYDHRGNGRSELCDETTWNLAQWGDDLKGLCDVLGVEKPVVIGTSFGGFVTLSYATRHLGHAAGHELISTAAKIDFPRVYYAFDRLGGPEVRTIAESYWERPTTKGRTFYRDHCLPLYSQNKSASKDRVSRVLRRDETALWFNGPSNEHGRMDFRGDLPRINCPTLVLAGEEDPITPPEFSDEIAAGLRSDSLTYLKFPACGHGVVNDKPHEAMAALRGFILSLEA
ncbi:MAG: alpha/beta hydrolase [Pseudorhodobacter sp.]|nr:alpha/beta hydrolase [Pseudorhodobacter sp.]